MNVNQNLDNIVQALSEDYVVDDSNYVPSQQPSVEGIMVSEAFNERQSSRLPTWGRVGRRGFCDHEEKLD